MERNLNYAVYFEDGAFIARCLDVEVASEGDTREGAVANLREALELYFEDHTSSCSTIFGWSARREVPEPFPRFCASPDSTLRHSSNRRFIQPQNGLGRIT